MTAKDGGNGHVNCGLALRARGCDDYAAGEDEESADVNCERWKLLECQPRDGLSGEKEKDHVEAEQFAEVQGRRVDGPSVPFEPALPVLRVNRAVARFRITRNSPILPLISWLNDRQCQRRAGTT